MEPVKEFAVGEVSGLKDKDRARLQALSLLALCPRHFFNDALAPRKHLQMRLPC